MPRNQTFYILFPQTAGSSLFCPQYLKDIKDTIVIFKLGFRDKPSSPPFSFSSSKTLAFQQRFGGLWETETVELPLSQNGYLSIYSNFLNLLSVFGLWSQCFDSNLERWCGFVGISRDSMHKRRATGGKKKAWRKKRK
jgi:hypothetical protein